jgi:hypothetical protein
MGKKEAEFAAPHPASGEAEPERDEKQDKRERKRLEAGQEPLEMRERLRNQWEVVGLQRRILQDMDRSVRYGLVIFTAANTGAALLISRTHLVGGESGQASLALKILMVLYLALAAVILMSSLRSLRPVLTTQEILRLGKTVLGEESFRPLRVMLPLLPTKGDLERLRGVHQAWQSSSGEEISLELTETSLLLKSLIETKHAAVHQLYVNLVRMLVVVAVLSVAIGLILR